MDDYLSDHRLPYSPTDRYDVYPYIIRKVYPDEKWETVYCDQCGNLANALTVGFEGLKEFYVPICNSHAQAILDADPEAWVNDHKLVLTPALAEQMKRQKYLIRQNKLL